MGRGIISISIMQLSQISFNPDFAIFVLIMAVMVYALLLGQEKVKTLALSTYVGIVLATEAAPPLARFLADRHWDFNGGLGEGIVQLALFALPLLTLEVGKRHQKHHRSHNRILITLLMAIATAFLIIAYGTQFVGSVGLKDFLDQSTLATQIYNLKLAWTAAVPLLIVAQSFIRHHD